MDIDKLAETLHGFGAAYLLTVTDDQRVRAVQVEPELRHGRLQVGTPGRRTGANLVQRPDVTLLFPPLETGGYSLIIDGQASASEGGASGHPVTAVLHRPASRTPATPGECEADCLPLGGQPG